MITPSAKRKKLARMMRYLKRVEKCLLILHGDGYSRGAQREASKRLYTAAYALNVEAVWTEEEFFDP